jgi:hypothetical protein
MGGVRCWRSLALVLLGEALAAFAFLPSEAPARVIPAPRAEAAQAAPSRSPCCQALPPSRSYLLASRPAKPVQKLDADASGQTAELASEHFEIVYDPQRVSAGQAEEARKVAEQGWEKCERLFGTTPEGKLKLDLSPNFYGATGFARPGDPKARDPNQRPLIGVRYADLEYLGLSGEYVLTHEIAHIFSGKLAGSTLGEGIADWGAGSFSGIPMRPWWGSALKRGGLWLDVDAFFITGEFEASPEVDAVIRTAQYAESGLLVQFLVSRFGWDKFQAFAGDYSKARGRLNSNEDRKRIRLPQRSQPRSEAEDPRLPPNAPEVRAAFQRHFGRSWEDLRSEWEQEMAKDVPPPGQAERLAMAHQIYGTIRNYEMWVIEQRPGPGAEARKLVKSAFTEANRALGAGDVRGASQALARARGLIEQLRRPKIIARESRLPGAAAGQAALR